MESQAVELELLGAARLLAGRAVIRLPATGTVPLAVLLRELARAAPALVGTAVTEQGALLGGHALCRGGTDLLRDPEEPVRPGESLLLLSTAGGG